MLLVIDVRRVWACEVGRVDFVGLEDALETDVTLVVVARLMQVAVAVVFTILLDHRNGLSKRQRLHTRSSIDVIRITSI